MKTKILSTALLLLIVFKTSFSQSSFQKAYGGVLSDEAMSIKKTVDGGYIMTGWTNSFGAGGNDVYLIKTNSFGDTLWTKTFGGTGNDEGLSVLQTSDEGYIISGFTESFGAGQRDVYLIKTDSIGHLLWSKAIGGTNSEQGDNVLRTSDGGYITSYSLSLNNEGVMKTDSNGNLLWIKKYIINSNICNIYSIQGVGKTLIMTGGVDTDNGTSVCFIQADSNGSVLKSKIYYDGISDISYGYGRSVKQAKDRGYIITGDDFRSNANKDYAYFIKCDSIGNLSWLKILSVTGHEVGYSAIQTYPGDYVITGRTYNGWSDDVYLMKADSFGNMIWSKGIGDQYGDDWGYSFLEDNDGSYVIAGFTIISSGATQTDAYLIKTDTSGYSGCNEKHINTTVYTPAYIDSTVAAIALSVSFSDTIASSVEGSGGNVTTLCSTVGISDKTTTSQIDIDIYPNPTNGKLAIYLKNFVPGCEIQIYNTLGETIYNGFLNNPKNEIDLKNVSAGVYYLKVFYGEVQYTDKLIIK